MTTESTELGPESRGRVIRDFTKITHGAREIAYDWQVDVKDLPSSPLEERTGPEFGRRWKIGLKSRKNGRAQLEFGLYIEPLLNSAEEASCCRRHVDLTLTVFLSSLPGRPLRTRSLSALFDSSKMNWGWPDVLEAPELSWREDTSHVLFKLHLREPSAKATTADSAMDLVVRPQRLATLVTNFCDPRCLPDVLFRVHGRELVGFSGSLRYSLYLTKSGHSEQADVTDNGEVLDSPFGYAFPIPDHISMFSEGEVDAQTPFSDIDHAPSNFVSVEELQEEDSDYGDDEDCTGGNEDTPAFAALKPFLKEVEVKEFSYITFRALLQYIVSGIITFAPLSTTFRKKIQPRLKGLVKTDPSQREIEITRLNAAAIEHASSTFGVWKSISCSPKSMYRIARVHNAPLFIQKCFEAVTSSWCPEAVLEELSQKFYRAYAKEYLPVAKEYLVDNWEEISASPTFAPDLASVFGSKNPPLIEAVTEAIGSLSGDRSKRRKLEP